MTISTPAIRSTGNKFFWVSPLTMESTIVGDTKQSHTRVKAFNLATL